jgi:hypothetical protein
MLMRLLQFFLAAVALLLASCSSGPVSTASFYSGPPAMLVNGYAQAPPEAPAIVHRAIAAGNELQGVPYQYGGGHGRPSYGVDCSGTVSHVLRSCGMMRGAATSGAFKRFGESGPGEWITVFSKDGHVFMMIAGLRLDTGHRDRNTEDGPKWTRAPRNARGFTVRHPRGL